MAKQRLDIEISGNDSKFGAAADRTMRRLNGIGSTVRTMAGWFGVAFGAAAINNVIQYGSRVSDLAQSLGVSSEALQKMEYAAGQLGVSMEEISKAFLNMQRYAGEAMGGNGEYQDIFQRMGISMQELKSMSPEQMFMRIAQNVRHSQHSAEMVSDAMRLMGRNGAMVLGAMRDGFYESANSAAALATTIDNETIASLDRMSDKMEHIKKQSTSLAASFATWAWDKIGMAAGGFVGLANKFTMSDEDILKRQTAVWEWFGLLPKGSGGAANRSPLPSLETGEGGAAGAVSRLGAGINTSSVAPPAADALSRIGLFRGGTSQIERQKVNLLQQIASNTSRTAAAMNEDV